jgi:hypothetical protein
MSSLDSDIANAAKAAGGDAVIVLGEQDQVTGVVGSTFGDASGTYGSGNFNANAFSVGSARAVKEHNSRYWVIKYLQDVVPTVGTSTPAASP